jgi:uncharacterized membrane protein YcgQ (UPF0703/DUF1980 family)
MGISLVSTGEATQMPLEIEIQWYLMLNMAMLIFSATFIIHANCFINALTMYWRHSRKWIHKFHLFQTACAVGCHLCRVSDYFWVTDCYFKGYFNYVSYFIGVFVMDGIQVWKFNHIIIKQAHKFPRITKWFSLLTFGYIGITTKIVLSILIGTIIQSTVGVATFCVANLPQIAFVGVVGSDIVYHIFTLVWSFYLVINQYIGYRNEFPTTKTQLLPTRFIKQIGLNSEILYLMASDLCIIVFFGLVYFGLTGLVNPEVFMQIKWAIHTKCISQMMQNHTKSQMDHYRVGGGLGSTNVKQSSDKTLCKKKTSKLPLFARDTQDSISSEDSTLKMEKCVFIEDSDLV